MAMQAKEWTVSGLATELGLAHRTVAKRLQGVDPIGKKGKSPTYSMRSAAIACFGPSDLLDLTQEKARLAKVQTEKQELELKIRKGEAAYLPDVEREWIDMVGAVRAKLLALPGQLANRITGDRAEIEGSARTLVTEALNELGGSTEP